MGTTASSTTGEFFGCSITCLAENFLRVRAVEVLRDTPGGELVFVGDEQNLWRFLNDQ
jgi:hypothetical protein